MIINEKFSLSGQSAITVEKLLGGAEGCLVQFFGAVNELEARAKLAMQALGVITHDVKAAAGGGTLGTERTHDHVPASPHGHRNRLDVIKSLLRFGKEMKHSAVM